MKNISNHQMLRNLTIILFAGGIIGIAIKFIALFEHWVYFPIYPNFVDAIFLMVGAVYLSWRALRHD